MGLQRITNIQIFNSLSAAQNVGSVSKREVVENLVKGGNAK